MRASGRYQARYRGPDGLMHSADGTFPDTKSAERWLTLKEAEVIRGEWVAPLGVRVKLGEYAAQWIRERPIQPRTRELYEGLLRLHIVPFLGPRTLDRLTPAAIRTWRRTLLDKGRSEIVAAKAYRLLRAVLNAAVREDRLIRENPCRIPGFDKEVAVERPVGTVGQVVALAGAVDRRYRALVFVAAFTGLRWGELVALRSRDLDLDSGTVRVARKFAELQNGERVPGPPKSAAGVRTVAIPSLVVEVLRRRVQAVIYAYQTGLVSGG
jgi:integrase